ncbi:hypothetical protein BCh11DRAFT_04243 [Burkholderia sp. Ch1-1]|nr:hypothetical protein BCh11DRAFT_04243 [Burkholderia sp. Ch1-1]
MGDRTVFGFGRLYSKTVLKQPEQPSIDTRKYPYDMVLARNFMFSKIS